MIVVDGKRDCDAKVRSKRVIVIVMLMLMRSQYSKGAGRPFISHLQDMLDLVWFEQCITEDGRGLVTSAQ